MNKKKKEDLGLTEEKKHTHALAIIIIIIHILAVLEIMLLYFCHSILRERCLAIVLAFLVGYRVGCKT